MTAMREHRQNGERIDVVSRKEFLREFAGNYAPGQHVTFIGPTQRGKTTLGLECLNVVISPEHQAVILAGKPPKRDHTMNAAAEKLNLRIVEQWPPTPSVMDRYKKRRGYVLRPTQHMKDLNADRETVRGEFKRAMLSNYSSERPVITFVDEAHHVQNDLKLKDEYEAPLMRGAPINAEWSLIQRGRFMSYLAYDAPDHLFIFYDPDISNQKRYSEIGGVDPGYLSNVTSQLRTYRTPAGQTISECVYIRRSGPEMCIVDVS